MKITRQKIARIWNSTARTVLWTLTVISCAGMLVGAYAGSFNPSSFKGLVFMLMSFPLWVLFALAVALLNAVWCRKALVASVAALILSAGAIWDNCPLNIFGPDKSRYADCPQFSLLTYNVYNYRNFWRKDTIAYSETMSYILHQNADIVNLQESSKLQPWLISGLNRAQCDSLKELYPYRFRSGTAQAVLSKYPTTVLYEYVDEYRMDDLNPFINVYDIKIDGVQVTLVDVHLQSYQLTKGDKALYGGLTKLRPTSDSLRTKLSEAKTALLSKVIVASERRAMEADTLVKIIDKYGTKNTIVAGDFNDVPGCYTLRKLEKLGFKNAYSEAGVGPAVTYGANRLYFRIDHVMYRGDLVALSAKGDKVKLSDHYPLRVTFAIDTLKHQ